MFKTLAIIAVLVVAAFLIIGAVNHKGAGKEYYGAVQDISKQAVKDIKTGAEKTTEVVKEKTKTLTETK